MFARAMYHRDGSALFTSYVSLPCLCIKLYYFGYTCGLVGGLFTPTVLLCRWVILSTSWWDRLGLVSSRRISTVCGIFWLLVDSCWSRWPLYFILGLSLYKILYLCKYLNGFIQVLLYECTSCLIIRVITSLIGNLQTLF